MRTGRCPKCGGHRVATTAYPLYLGAGIAGPTLDLYACADCRYVEQYLRDSVESRVALLPSWRWVRADDGPFR